MVPTLKTLLRIAKNNTFLFSLMPVVLCSLAYLYQVLELKKWEIPLGMVDGMRIQYLLIIVVGIFYCFSASYLQEFIRLRFDYYVPGYIANNFLRKNLRRIARQLPTKSKGDNSNEIVRVKKLCNELRFSVAKSIFLATLLGSLCFLPFYMLFFVIVLNTSIPSVFLFYALTILTTVLFAYRFNGRQMRKEIRRIKNQIKKDDKTPEAYIIACGEISKLESARVKKLSNHNDTNAVSLDYLAVPLTAIVMFFLCMLLNLCSLPQQDYWIYTNDDGENFASVFELGDSFILKRATIENDEITIFLDDQMSIKATGISMRHSLFKKVTVKKDDNL